MNVEIVKNLSPEQVAIIFAVIIYVTKEAASFVAKTFLHTKDKTQENTQALRELNISIHHLNERLVITEKKIEEFNDTQKLIWKLERDINFAFDKLRDLRQS